MKNWKIENVFDLFIFKSVCYHIHLPVKVNHNLACFTFTLINNANYLLANLIDMSEVCDKLVVAMVTGLAHLISC